jgi:hypothetical protein
MSRKSSLACWVCQLRWQGLGCVVRDSMGWGVQDDLCAEEKKNVPQGLKAEWVWRIDVRVKAHTYQPYPSEKQVTSSRPCGTFRLLNLYPGLRPGLSSAVPPGLILQSLVLTQTLKPVPTSPYLPARTCQPVNAVAFRKIARAASRNRRPLAGLVTYSGLWVSQGTKETPSVVVAQLAVAGP